MFYLYQAMEIYSNHCDTTVYASQALAAASKTVETMKIVHNFHCYFLLVGDINSKG
jgi:acyl-coenzyme A thioesterase 1/2/4